ncbi:MAG: M18 family aminopeptidase [Actinobacteria bacterium]|nr:M18 family aminopeptidase [Actinomycetota bacterium]
MNHDRVSPDRTTARPRSAFPIDWRTVNGSGSTDLSVLCGFLDRSPTPWHAVDTAAGLLLEAGFEAFDATDTLEATSTRCFIRRDGSLIAWTIGRDAKPTTPFRIAAAHTDSPGFRIKVHPESVRAGCRRLGVEVYGGPLLNSWLDRDLGLAGRVLVETGNNLEVRPILEDRPILRIPQLAIHLDRGVNDNGLKLDRQEHLQLLFGLESSVGAFIDHVARIVDVAPAAIRGWDLAPYDLEPARCVGGTGELLASARLDDLVSCHAAIEALIRCDAEDVISVVVLVDHEEVGSATATGAQSAFIANVLERIGRSVGADRDEHLRALVGSHALSLDMAHATHPNHPERHDPNHVVHLNGGPVLKHNARQRYATTVTSAAPFIAACDAADVDIQHFVSHSEMPCGSTIGPVLSTTTGIPVADVGVAQLAMHSIREVCGTADPGRLERALTHYLSHR